MDTYQRPLPTADDIETFKQAAAKITRQNGNTIRNVLASLMAENHSLALEVNAHRAALGYEPLPLERPKL